jgi:hypothetical protein
MVKKRLFFLVLLQVASILVSSQDDPIATDGQEPIIAYDGEGAVAEFVDTPQVVYDGEGAVALEDIPVVIDDSPYGEYPEPPVVPYLPPDVEQEITFPVDDDDDDIIPEDIEIFTRPTTRRRKKTTTPAPIVPCIELPEIIEAKAREEASPMEGYTADQCAFVITNEESCAWEYHCGMTVTETPIVEAPPPPEEEEDEDESAENEIEECEPKKKFKFENCFLKIRGLIKKKKPKRC